MKPKIHTIHTTALKKNSILMILKYPSNLNHNALTTTQRNIAVADVLNSWNEKKPFADSPFAETLFLHPIPTIDASFSHNPFKAKSESQPVCEANHLNNRQHATIWDSSWTSCSYTLSGKATRKPVTGECDCSCKGKVNVNKHGYLLQCVSNSNPPGSVKKAASRFLSPPHISLCCVRRWQAKGFPSWFFHLGCLSAEPLMCLLPTRPALWPALNANKTWQCAKCSVTEVRGERNGEQTADGCGISLLCCAPMVAADAEEKGIAAVRVPQKHTSRNTSEESDVPKFDYLPRLCFQTGQIYLCKEKLHRQHPEQNSVESQEAKKDVNNCQMISKFRHLKLCGRKSIKCNSVMWPAWGLSSIL